MQLRIVTTSLFLFSFLWLSAQPQLGLHFMRQTLQSSYTNPALLPDDKLVISLPNVYSHLELTGPSTSDLFSSEGGQTFFNVAKALPALEEINSTRNHTTIETIGASIGLGNLRLGINHAAHLTTFFQYSDDLARLIWNGNGPYVGQELSLDNRFQINSYHEIGLAAAYEVKNFTIGGRVKLLSGIGDVSSGENHGTLFTDPDIYQLSMTTDFNINSSSYFTFTSVEDFDTNIDFTDLSFDKIFGKNSGIGFDIGAKAQFGKIHIAASAIDIGGITWTENLNNYRSAENFTYEGIDFTQAILGEGADFSNALDSLQDIFSVTSTSVEYETKLPQKIYLSGAYQLNDVWLLGASFFNESFIDQTNTAISVGAQAGIKDWLTVGGHYGIYNDNLANIGLNATAKLSAVQILVASDNVIGLFDIGNTSFTNFRMGLNVVLGKRKVSEEVVPELE